MDEGKGLNTCLFSSKVPILLVKFKAALLFFELFPVTYTYIVTVNIHCYNLSILNMVKVSNTEISACINNPDWGCPLG